MQKRPKLQGWIGEAFPSRQHNLRRGDLLGVVDQFDIPLIATGYSRVDSNNLLLDLTDKHKLIRTLRFFWFREIEGEGERLANWLIGRDERGELVGVGGDEHRAVAGGALPLLRPQETALQRPRLLRPSYSPPGGPSHLSCLLPRPPPPHCLMDQPRLPRHRGRGPAHPRPWRPRRPPLLQIRVTSTKLIAVYLSLVNVPCPR